MMANAIKTASNNVRRMPRWVLAVLLAGVVMADTGCTTVQTSAMKDAFTASGPVHTRGTAVTLLPVQETPENSAAKADPTYLGKGVRSLSTILILPFIMESEIFHADIPRTEIIRLAALSRLDYHGIPVIYQAKGGIDQIKILPEDHLAISLHLRKLSVDTDLNFMVPVIVVNAFEFRESVAHAVLDCQIWQSGGTTPLWQGTVDGTHLGNQWSPVTGVLSEAVSLAMDQCITKSGLQEIQARFANQRYAQLMASGREQGMTGDRAQALNLYGQAYGSAMTSEQSFDSIKAMALLMPGLPSKPVVPEEARKLKVQAEVAVREKRFKDAADLYGSSLNIAPWWPEGHFNLALVLSEIDDYKIAVREMGYYLQLAPNAPNARAAQDKIYEWEGKVQLAPDAPNARAAQDKIYEWGGKVK